MLYQDHDHYLENIDLHQSISLPSKVHPYSLGVEYMRNWFLNKFEDDFFKTVYINGRHIFDDFSRFNRTKLIKIEKPALSITPTVDYEFNRDNVDLKLGGLQVLTRRSRFHKDVIIQDYENNHFMQMVMELVKINFAFRMRVSTRAQQLDLYNYIKFAHRVGSTQKEFVDYDFHLPYEMMLNMASHNGFEISYPDEDDHLSRPKVKNIHGFLQYLNAHSMYPISYKMRTVSGNSDFFIRIPRLCTHISNVDQLQMDDGEREDQLENNFHIEMNCVLSIPAPQEYFYYSTEAVDMKLKFKNDIAGIYQLRPVAPPDKNQKGWREYISTEYIDEGNYAEEIQFEELLEGTDLYEAIKYVKSTFISPAVFVDVKLFNCFKERYIKIDWEKMAIIPDNPKLKSDISQISIYVDLDYFNNTISIIKSLDKGRYQ